MINVVTLQECEFLVVRPLGSGCGDVPDRHEAEGLARIPLGFLRERRDVVVHPDGSEAGVWEGHWGVEAVWRCPMCGRWDQQAGEELPETWDLRPEHGRILRLSDFVAEDLHGLIWMPGGEVVAPMSEEFAAGVVMALEDPWAIEVTVKIWHPSSGE